MNTNIKTGLMFNGICLGVKQITRTGNNGPYTQSFLGISVQRDTGYGLTDEIVDIQVPKKFLDDGSFSTLNNYRNKLVSAEVWVRAYPSKSGVGYGYMLGSSELVVHGEIDADTGEFIAA